MSVFEMSHNHPKTLAGALAFCILLELMSVSIYIWEVQNEIPWNVSSTQSLDHFHPWKATFIVQAVLNIWFTIVWILSVVFGKNPLMSFLSFYTVISLLSSVLFNIVSIGAAINWDAWNGSFVPLFLRIWWAYSLMDQLVSIPQLRLDTIITDLVMQLCFLVAVMTTSAGVFQVSESTTAKYLNFLDSAYFVTVTFSTVGYGDITAHSRISRLCNMCIIIAAMVVVPSVLTSSNEFLNLRGRFARFSRQRGAKHVVVIGKVTKESMQEILNEFYCGKRSLRPLNVVFFSSDKFSQDCEVMSRDPWYKNKVSLIFGDVAESNDMERAGIHTADAVFVMMDRSGTGLGDMDVVQNVWAVTHMIPEMPVYGMIRRWRSMSGLVTENSTMMECEELEYSLLGQSVLRPGTIPLLLNLLRSFDEPIPAVEGLEWLPSYDASRSQSIHLGTVPNAMVEKSFLLSALTLKRISNVTLIGVVTWTEESVPSEVVLLNPKHYLLQEADKLLFIAKEAEELSEFEDDSSSTLQAQYEIVEKKFGSLVDSVEMDPCAVGLNENGNGNDNNSEFSANEAPQTPRKAYNAFAHSVFVPTTELMKIRVSLADSTPLENAPTNILPDPNDPANDHCVFIPDILVYGQMRLKQLGLRDHIVVLDLNSLSNNSSPSSEEASELEESQSKDLWDIMHQIKSDDLGRDTEVVVLSRTKLNKSLLRRWGLGEKKWSPIIFVEGCGTGLVYLEALNLPMAAGVVIYSSGSQTVSDIVVAGVHHNVRYAIDNGAFDHYVPVVVKVQNVSNLHLFPPVFENPTLRLAAVADHTCVPKYIIGEALCASMLNTALYLSYDNKYLVEVMRRLVLGSSVPRFASSKVLNALTLRVKVRCLRVDQSTIVYREMRYFFEEMVKRGNVVIGVYRKIRGRPGGNQSQRGDENKSTKNEELLGYRYMITNPEIDTVLKDDDVVYYLG